MSTNGIASLPKIVAFLASHDSGEYGNATCPHCGALGRYFKTFKCDDGTTRGAMAGCIKLFGITPLAKAHGKLLDKLRLVEGKTWPDGRPKTLNKWDAKKLEAINAVIAGTMTEAEALMIVKQQEFACSEWMAKKGYR